MESSNSRHPDSRHPEHQYLDLLKDIMANGVEKHDHNTGISLKSVFGRTSRYDLTQGFPLLTTKRVYWKGVLHELYWFLSGQSNIKYLVDNDVHIWDDYPYKIYLKHLTKESQPLVSKEEFVANIKNDGDFAAKWGELPHIYGSQWRHWPAKGREIDQIAWAVDTLKNFPERKHAVVTVWNPEFLYGMALPGQALSFPLCHIMLHFNVAAGKLSCLLYQRSCDFFLGVPFNIASYALLTHAMAKICGYEPGEFVHVYGDAHVYSNHFPQVAEQMAREPRAFPTLKISDDVTSLDSFTPDKVTLTGYDPHPPIKGDLTVAGGFDEKDRTLGKVNYPDLKAGASS